MGVMSEGAVLLWMGMLVLSGIIRLIGKSSAPARERDRPSRDVNPAPLGADAMPVIGGASCVHCASRIESRLDGTACANCVRPMHHECRAPHLERCGRVASSYRT
jgi:hypothetical protein